MDETKALEILRILADGIDPYTGESYPTNSPYQNPDTVRALCIAVRTLEKRLSNDIRRSNLPVNAGKPWSADEDVKLSQAFDTGSNIAELAKTFGRTRLAIQSRLMKLGKIPSNFLVSPKA